MAGAKPQRQTTTDAASGADSGDRHPEFETDDKLFENRCNFLPPPEPRPGPRCRHPFPWMGLRSSRNKMSEQEDNQVVISASGKHTATLIFLHGLGDTGHGWASTLAEIRPPHLKVVCPTAPTIPVTLNSGFQMPAWFDLFSLDPNGAEDVAGIKKSSEKVTKLVEAELEAGVDPKNVILGGFSQGGALALYTGLKLKDKVGGVVALSCWLPMHKEVMAAHSVSKEGSGSLSSSANAALPPVLQCHGDCDPVLPYKWGQLTSVLLKQIVPEHEFKTYRGLGHSSADEEMDDVKKFLERVTAPRSD